MDMWNRLIGHILRNCTKSQRLPSIFLNLRDELLEWDRIYNTVRPHQALDYLTPLKFLEQWEENQRKEVACHYVLDEYKYLTSKNSCTDISSIIRVTYG